MEKSDVTATLLVGLGGLGSGIVNEIYGLVKKNGQDKRVEAVVIDTDIGSLNKNTNIDPIFRIQTSENSTVRGLLERDPSCKEWFPEHPVILNSQILEGAGMVRAISRLALKTAIKNVRKAVEAQDKAAAVEALNVAYTKLDQAVSSVIHHKNYAIRQKSRLSKAVNALN